MKGKKKRVLASFMAVLMVVGLLPLTMFGDPVQVRAESSSGTATDCVAEGTHDFIKLATIDDVNAIQGLSTTNVDKHESHGITTNGGSIKLSLEKDANITVTECMYGTAPITASSGKVENTVAYVNNSVDGVYTITGAKAGELTITFESGTRGYIHSIAVEYLPESSEVVDEANNFKEWLDDLAEEETVKDPESGEDKIVKTVKTGTHEYGGGNVTLVGKGETQFTVFTSAANVIRDGEKHNGYKAGNRHDTANEIPSIPKAGEGCCVEFESKVTGMFKVYFWSSSYLRVWDFDTSTGKGLGYTDSKVAADFYAFETKPGHTYVMSTTGKTNNMAYVGYEFIQNNQLEVPVEFSNVDADADKVESMEITITDAALGTKAASVTKDTTAVSLLKNHTYVIESNDGGIRPEVSGKDSFVATGDKVTFELNNVSDVTLTGAITGTSEGTVTSLKFVNMVNSSTYTATINGSSYSCSMKPGEYNTIVETTNGGKTYDRVSVKAEGTNVNEVYVEVPDPGKARKYGPAGIAELEITGTTALRPDNGGDFTGKEGATIKVPVSGKANVVIETYYEASYKVNGKDYTNTTKSTSTNQADSMVVDGDFVIEVTGGVNTTYFRGISVTPIVEFKNTISVPGDYKTLNEAFTAISGMEGRPEGEAGRVTVELNCDIFEQTVVNAPYVTLKGNGHTVSWYYGVGTLYYSVDPSTGLYNERLARDKYSYKEGDGNLWGGVFIVRGNNFIAEDTTFKNTYNYELTDAEKSDIAGSTLSVSRLADGANVAAYAYKERSNAFYIEADNIECYNCKILSSQDTLGRNGSTNNGYHAYFNKCVIGGNVDYICGEFAAVFDNCELQWKTYAGDTGSNNGKIGYIVAPKTSPNVFRNCTITLDDKNAPGVAGLYGRTWGKDSNAVFINTETNGYIKADGWGEMSGGEKATAVFKEYNNTSNGKAFVSTGTSSDNQTLDAVKDYIETEDVSIVNTVLNNWIPVHYAYEITKPDVPGEKPDVPGEKPGEEPGEEPGKDDDKVIVKPEKPENVDPAKDVVMSGVTASSDVEFKDNAGNVVLSGTVEIKAEPITNTVDKTDLVSKVNSIMSQVSNVAVRGQWYVDINAKSGSNVVKVSQGTLTISLSIPTDITYNPLVDVVTVLHKKADGTIKSETVTKGGGRTISFTVNSLSPFAIVVSTPVYGFGDGNTDNDSNDNSLVADASNGSTANSGTASSTAKSETGTSVKTGDSAPVVPLVLISAACLGVLVICSKKRAR